MSVDVVAVGNVSYGEGNGIDGNVGDGQMVNGVVVNGHHSSGKHKSSSKDKHRDKDRDREHKSSSHKSSSSSHRHKHSSSSSSKKDKHHDKERSESGKHHHSSSSGGGSSSHRDKEKREKSDGEKSKEKSEHKSSSSSHRHKSSSSSSSKDKERSKERHESSSSSSSNKDKERHKSSSSHHGKDREKDRDKHHRSSSSSKHKHSSSKSHSSSSSATSNFRTDDGFVKPEPVAIQPNNEFNLENHFNNAYTNGGGDNKMNGNSNGYTGGAKQHDIMKQENSEYNFDVSQTSSCDYSMSQFKDDEPDFVIKKEASLDGTEQEQEHYAGEDQEAEQTQMDVDEEDIPLAVRNKRPISQTEMKIKEEQEEASDDEEDIPLLARQKIKKEAKKEKKKKSLKREKEEPVEDEAPKKKKKVQPEPIKPKQENVSPTKRKKKEEEEVEVWRWWEEEKRDDGVKWTTLEHKGPVFAPPYERLPKNVRFYYDGKALELSEETEEAATFYAKMLNHDYCTKDVFNKNFFNDFRKTMNAREREIIRDFKKCNFEEMHHYFVAESEKRKNATKEEKEARKRENEEMIKEYGFCWIDGHKEKIGNFKLEPPGLFRGRGEHPKMGMIKRRIRAEDITINCGKESKIPQPPHGHRWKEVRHDTSVTWLASWVENVQGQVKYIMLNPSSKLKGEKDHVKYETARKLDKCIDKIRSTYRDEWKSKEMRVRQRAVALYFIDKLALRAGNEKDEDQADTVGCCSLRVEHVQLHKELNGKEYVVVFDFLGKDSIRYYNEVEVEKRVFKNLELFMENKKEGDDLFDRLNTQVLNEHLKELMEGLTAKVFRTYNASITLQNQLDLLTKDDMTVEEKLLAYNRANRAVAILCNHQRAVPKSHQKSMDNLKEKIKNKEEQVREAEKELNSLQKLAKKGSVKEKINADKKAKQLERLKQQLKKLQLQETDRDENKTIALGTSKLNYLDPRISVAWCKKHGVPIEKIFNKTQRTKFMWAIHMADENYRF